MANLTKAQARLVREIGEIENELRLDRRALAERQAPDDDLTTLLVLLRKRLVSAEIVHEYTFLDELLAMIAADYFFRTPGGKNVWRTKRFRRFDYFILERLSVLEKMALVNDIRALPRGVRAYVGAVNDLRNAVAHAFFPESLKGDRTSYKGRDIFTLDGFRALRADREPAIDVLWRRAFR